MPRYSFVLNGKIKVGKQTWVEGHYAFIPAGMAVGAIEVSQGAEALLMFNDSEPSFAESDKNHQLALTDAFSSVNSYEDKPWGGGSIVSPAVLVHSQAGGMVPRAGEKY